MASVAAPSASSYFFLSVHFPAAKAAASVTLTRSIDKLLFNIFNPFLI
jgi:hypothetical protein